MSELNKKISSFFKNFFIFEKAYFTIGGFKKNLSFFLKGGHLFRHFLDRIRFYIYPKLLIGAQFPTHLEVEAASKCQMRCPMCWTTYMPEKIKGIMKFDLFKKIVDEAASNNTFSIKLSWRGEPMLNPKIIEMVKYAKEKGIPHVAFLTNAELLTKKKSAELIESGLDWISISADGTDQVYNKIRFPAKFEETLERVKYLRDLRDSKNLTKPLIRVQSVHSALENNSEKYYESWKNIADKINVISDQIRDVNKKITDLDYDKYFMCPKPWQRLAIGHDGKVHQCIADYYGENILGNINIETIKQVWNGKKNLALRKTFMDHVFYKANTPCSKCVYGLKQETGFLKSSMNKLKIKIRKYKSVPDIVTSNKVNLETPTELIPQSKVEEYKKIISQK